MGPVTRSSFSNRVSCSRVLPRFECNSARSRKRLPSSSTVVAECLEQRVLLTAGDIAWNLPYDIRPSGFDAFDAVAVQADGKTVAVGGAEFDGTFHFVIARFNANGTLDTTFSNDGIRIVQFAGRGSRATSVALRADGKILVGGFSSETSGGSNLDVTLVQLNTDGTADLSFGALGAAIWVAPPASEGHVSGRISVAPDGGIVASGYYLLGGTVGYLVRFTASGALDLSFDGDGVRTVNDQIVDAAIDPAGSVVALAADGTVYRFMPSGAFDPSFSGDGVLSSISPESGFDPFFTAVDVAPDGKIVIVGRSTLGGIDQTCVIRLLPNGLYDASFDGNGRKSFSITPSTSETVEDVEVLPDGSILVAGQNTTGDWVTALLTPSGQFSAGYSEDGKLIIDAGEQDFLGGIATAPNGDFLLVGHVDHAGTDSSSAIARVAGPRAADDLVGYFAGEWRVGRSTKTSFESGTWATWADVSWDELQHGDFNGDGKSDVLGLLNGNWWVGIADGTGFQTSLFGGWADVAWQHVTVADMNNDGLDDILAFVGGQWWGADSDSTHFKVPTLRATWANVVWSDVAVVELNGDGRKDLLGRTGGQWWVSTGGGLVYDSKFFNTSLWATWADAAWSVRTTADVTGDGLADLVGLINGQWWVGRSTGSSFTTSQWATWANVAWTDVRTGDFNGDGRDDVAARVGGQWWVGVSGGALFATSHWATWANIAWQDVRVGDFDGDGRDDIVARTGANWWVGRSNGAVFTTSLWGTWSNVAWQAVAAVETSTDTSAGPPAGPGVTSAALFDEPAPQWSIWTEDDELSSLLLAG